jgi:ferredoxin-NADP reductase
LLLRLKEKRELAPNLYEFVFSATERLRFKPGQYLEWTLPQVFFESRGNRRYFTIASSPTEDDLRLGVRFGDDGSQFKRNLLALRSSDILQASNLSGNFIMPEDTKQKLVFIAGGIGITPFRSMLKYLIDRNEKRDVVLIYACLAARDFAYRDILKAAEVVGVRTLFLVTDPTLTIASLPCETGYLTVELLQRMIPDFKDRLYYLSGPDAMVRSYERMLHDCSISRALIKKDYFPGF